MEINTIASVLLLTTLFGSCCNMSDWLGGGGATIGGLTDRSGGVTADGGITTERVQTVSGRIMNPAGADATEFGGRVYIDHNGNRQQVTPTQCYETDCAPGEWTYSGDLVLDSGSNQLTVIVEDDSGNVVSTSPTFGVNADIPPRDITVTLTWETDGNDVDLHIYDPSGNHAYYSYLAGIPGGNLDLDDRDGYGPETFTMEHAVPGEYTVKVRYYSTHGVTSEVPVTVRISLNEGAQQAYTHTFTAEQANMDDATNDWTVATFTMPQ
ncbi:DUF2135 domain-containing protein [Candidatus Micrarchaeota archaeon]|nr:DUF2135 domain-containing protein [Candidatus Micrarchaeota archaeon]